MITQTQQFTELRKVPVGSSFRTEYGDVAKLASVNSCAATVEIKGKKTYKMHVYDDVTGETNEVKFTGPRRSMWALGTRVVVMNQQELELSERERRENDGQAELDTENDMSTKRTAKKNPIKTATKPTTKPTAKKAIPKKTGKNSVKESAAPKTADSDYPFSMQELHRQSGVSVLTLRKYVSRPELLKEIPHDQNQRGHMMFNDASVKAVIAIKERNQAAVGTKG